MSLMPLETSQKNMGKGPEPGFYVRIGKRIFDLLIAIPVFIILLPIMIIIGIIIKCDSQGTVIFKQKRAGLYGNPFIIYKFRTMTMGADRGFKLNIDQEKLDEFIFQSEDDGRITGVGAFLRRTSLDELPQLWNVIKGDMSLIGPRPEIFEVVYRYTGYHRQRLNVKPGITGLAQVMGRGELTLGETVEYDLKYIERLSFKEDIWILWRTIGVVFTGQGAR
ncbi:sugar transferase [Xylanivirga thermophila]|jgi:lipopolysaccharide/colanic/teichoic acid biosynthesis glycosyltransferase|uniref:sugar transferase n=1 Tax=Xylanivirga thermophila TaxID=2496273 RepID=UPI001FB320F6|nr:sugar transferase [Xylanivirga thermophila]